MEEENVEFRTLIKRRGAIKAKQTLFKKRFEVIKNEIADQSSLSEVPKEMILELQSRLENLNKLFSDYDEIQNSIEVECDDNNLEQQLIQREEFEDLHYSLASECKNIIDNYYSLTEDRSASIRSGESEHHSSTHSQMVEHCEIKLPSINLPKFSGDYKNWMEFRDFFISIIHMKENIPQINKFHYLRSSLEGGAAQELSCLVIPAISDSYPTNQLNVKSWQIPKNIRLADTQFYKPGEVDLLIGGGIYLNLLCIGQVTLGPNLPTLQKTKLGWVVGGDAIAGTINPTYRCNFVGNLHEDIVKFWELEEPNVVKPVWSEEDKCCEEIFVSTVSRNQEGRFVVQIPFKISPDEHLENPFSVDANEIPTALQLELIDLQCSDLHKEKHRDGNLLEFYKCLDKNKFPNIIDTAQQILCLFGSTYFCEQTFSVLNLNKNDNSSMLTDAHLNDILRTATSKFVPKYDDLVSKKRVFSKFAER
nr:unnamed protein product [Callosobruchus analis]